MNERPTPETDAAEFPVMTWPKGDHPMVVRADLARTLERERDHYKWTLEKIAAASCFDNINGWARNVAKDALHSLHNAATHAPGANEKPLK